MRGGVTPRHVRLGASQSSPTSASRTVAAPPSYLLKLRTASDAIRAGSSSGGDTSPKDGAASPTRFDPAAALREADEKALAALHLRQSRAAEESAKRKERLRAEDVRRQETFRVKMESRVLTMAGGVVGEDAYEFK